MANFLTMYWSAEDAITNTNALAVPTPSYSSAKQTSSTLVNSGRSAFNGQVYAQRVSETNLTKIEIVWKYLTATQWSDVQQKILNNPNEEAYGFYIWIKYFDMETATFRCKKFYPSDRTATPFKLDPVTKAVTGWLDCSINFIDTGATEANLT